MFDGSTRPGPFLASWLSILFLLGISFLTAANEENEDSWVELRSALKQQGWAIAYQGESCFENYQVPLSRYIGPGGDTNYRKVILEYEKFLKIIDHNECPSHVAEFRYRLASAYRYDERVSKDSVTLMQLALESARAVHPMLRDDVFAGYAIELSEHLMILGKYVSAEQVLTEQLSFLDSDASKKSRPIYRLLLSLVPLQNELLREDILPSDSIESMKRSYLRNAREHVSYQPNDYDFVSYDSQAAGYMALIEALVLNSQGVEGANILGQLVERILDFRYYHLYSDGSKRMILIRSWDEILIGREPGNRDWTVDLWSKPHTQKIGRALLRLLDESNSADRMYQYSVKSVLGEIAYQIEQTDQAITLLTEVTSDRYEEIWRTYYSEHLSNLMHLAAVYYRSQKYSYYEGIKRRIELFIGDAVPKKESDTWLDWVEGELATYQVQDIMRRLYPKRVQRLSLLYPITSDLQMREAIRKLSALAAEEKLPNIREKALAEIIPRLYEFRLASERLEQILAAHFNEWTSLYGSAEGIANIEKLIFFLERIEQVDVARKFLRLVTTQCDNSSLEMGCFTLLMLGGGYEHFLGNPNAIHYRRKAVELGDKIWGSYDQRQALALYSLGIEQYKIGETQDALDSMLLASSVLKNVPDAELDVQLSIVRSLYRMGAEIPQAQLRLFFDESKNIISRDSKHYAFLLQLLLYGELFALNTTDLAEEINLAEEIEFLTEYLSHRQIAASVNVPDDLSLLNTMRIVLMIATNESLLKAIRETEFDFESFFDSTRILLSERNWSGKPALGLEAAEQMFSLAALSYTSLVSLEEGLSIAKNARAHLGALLEKGKGNELRPADLAIRAADEYLPLMAVRRNENYDKFALLPTALDAMIVAIAGQLVEKGDVSEEEILALSNDVFVGTQALIFNATANSFHQTSQNIIAKEQGLSGLIEKRDVLASRLSETELKVGEMIRLENELSNVGQALSKDMPFYRELSQNQPIPLPEVQELLGNNEALFIVGDLSHGQEKVSWGAIVTKQEFKWREYPVDEIQKYVKIIRSSFGIPGDLNRFDVNASYELYRILLEEFESTLSDVNHLIIIPSGPMSSLPMSMLVTEQPKGDEVAWFSKKYATTTLPSVTSLKAMREAVGSANGTKKFLGIGDPYFGEQALSKQDIFSGNFLSVRGATANRAGFAQFAALPKTRAELRSMARVLNGDPQDLYFRERASETTIKSLNLSQYRNIAFATHALVAGEFEGFDEPSLVLSLPDVSDEVDDGLLTASEISSLKLDADWIILSACNTGASDGSVGADGLSGLVKAFFFAGARSLLVSHWAVEDTSTTFLTTETIKQFSSGASKSESLRQAQLKMINGELGPEFMHPVYWAPFTVVGGLEPLPVH